VAAATIIVPFQKTHFFCEKSQFGPIPLDFAAPPGRSAAGPPSGKAQAALYYLRIIIIINMYMQRHWVGRLPGPGGVNGN
tara:strand:+ start:165 stop:404 length:240 start_codon:yes stop_codon:yes gene_type:complete